MSLDETDEEILDGLKENGRISYRELSERTGVTPPTVKSRVDKLRENGIIEGFTVELNKERMVPGTVADALIEVEVGSGDKDSVSDAFEAVEAVTEVMKTADSNVLIRCTGTQEDLDEVLNGLPDEVTGYQTTLITG